MESGVTLFMIALQVGRPVAVLQDANCLRDADRIDAGQVIYVPRLPAGLDVRREVQGCNNPDITITSPRPNQRFSRSFDVIGTVDPPLFGYFNLEIRADEADGYNFLSRSDDVVRDGLLGRIDASLFTDGRYWVRVVMVDATGNVPANASCAIPITLD
ncbi:MAG: LysM domain-containing protein [Anaerolineaceae bacterium]|nr:MAG: LysM domain-containing protein [Anaerolineaceae bacterium]